MGQTEVLEFLKTHKNKWWTSKEISQHIDSTRSRITTALRKLRVTNFIFYREVLSSTHRGGSRVFQYKYKKQSL